MGEDEIGDLIDRFNRMTSRNSRHIKRLYFRNAKEKPNLCRLENANQSAFFIQYVGVAAHAGVIPQSAVDLRTSCII